MIPHRQTVIAATGRFAATLLAPARAQVIRDPGAAASSPSASGHAGFRDRGRPSSTAGLRALPPAPSAERERRPPVELRRNGRPLLLLVQREGGDAAGARDNRRRARPVSRDASICSITPVPATAGSRARACATSTKRAAIRPRSMPRAPAESAGGGVQDGPRRLLLQQNSATTPAADRTSRTGHWEMRLARSMRVARHLDAARRRRAPAISPLPVRRSAEESVRRSRLVSRAHTLLDARKRHAHRMVFAPHHGATASRTRRVSTSLVSTTTSAN